jgi:uncharacterized surface protein with fasciclin (FAS1) repeats
MKKLISLAIILLLIFTSFSVFAAEGDIVDIAEIDGSFTTLISALMEADLIGALQVEGPVTVFAPTDEAFAKLLNDLDISAEVLLSQPEISKVLLYHVVSGKIMSTDLTNGLSVHTLNGENLTIDLSDGMKVNSSNIILADIETTNGVIHVIDTVLIPEGFSLVLTSHTNPITGVVGVLPFIFISLGSLTGILYIKKKNS